MNKEKIAIYEELIERIIMVEECGRAEREEMETYLFARGFRMALQQLVSYLKGRIEELKK